MSWEIRKQIAGKLSEVESMIAPSCLSGAGRLVIASAIVELRKPDAEYQPNRLADQLSRTWDHLFKLIDVVREKDRDTAHAMIVAMAREIEESLRVEQVIDSDFREVGEPDPRYKVFNSTLGALQWAIQNPTRRHLLDRFGVRWTYAINGYGTPFMSASRIGGSLFEDQARYPFRTVRDEQGEIEQPKSKWVRTEDLEGLKNFSGPAENFFKTLSEIIDNATENPK